MDKIVFVIIYYIILVVLLCKIIFYIKSGTLKFYAEDYKSHEPTPGKYHIITLNTPNYDHIGCYGANILKQYADKYGYTFEMYTENLDPNLHINYTKNLSIIDAIKKKWNTDIEYIVSIDSDIAIKNVIPLSSLFIEKPDAILYAPRDYWENPHEQIKGEAVINGGFTIWKKCKRAIEINKKWIELAKIENEIQGKKVLQQPVFTKYQSEIINPTELEFLDHKLVGMEYSLFVFQTKDTKKEWEKDGSPKLLKCAL